MFIVMCKVTGGLTGTRVAPAKRNGEIAYFDTREAAQAEADKWNKSMNENRAYSTATFRYWVEEA